MSTNQFVLPGRRTPTELVLSEDLDRTQWCEVLSTLREMERSVMWWLGDALRFGAVRKWGEKYDEAVEAGFAYDTARAALRLAIKFQFGRRIPNLSWTHHHAVEGLPPDQAEALLAEAERNKMSVAKLRQQVNQHGNCAYSSVDGPPGRYCGFDDLHHFVACGKKFGTIYADPPWLYDNQGTRAATGNHYEGLTVDQLCDAHLFPIARLAADAAHLHLWTTNAFLFEAPRIFAAWGFEFKSSFVWVKPEIGIGNYWRNAHEFLLTAVRGDNARHFADHNLRSWLECSRGKHSGKPDQVRQFIERASPSPRLELFARREQPGWAVWGNEIEQTLFDAPTMKMESVS